MSLQTLLQDLQDAQKIISRADEVRPLADQANTLKAEIEALTLKRGEINEVLRQERAALEGQVKEFRDQANKETTLLYDKLAKAKQNYENELEFIKQSKEAHIQGLDERIRVKQEELRSLISSIDAKEDERKAGK